jgi:DNA-binding transcriptional regulator YhcF (GntR family)
MAKKIIINESTLKKAIASQLLEEAGLTKSDVENIVKSTFKSDRQFNKDIEKKVKDIVANCVNTLFKTLWQRRNFYENEIKNN